MPTKVQQPEPPLHPTTTTSGSPSPLRSLILTSSEPAPSSEHPSQTTFGIACENATAPERVIVRRAPWTSEKSPLQLSVAVTAPLVTDSSSARAMAGANKSSAQAAARAIFIRQASRPAGGLSLGERPRNYRAHH